jgi:UDP-N-acetyl-D-mannosaminuronic acid dehydrogenase
MQYVISATESIVPYLRPGNLVVLESTSPPRTTIDLVAPILERSGLKAGIDFHLAYSPERVLPGKILQELIENARVIGGVDRSSAEAGRDLYALFVRGQIILTDATSAEMVKLMENTYRDVNIAIANEFSRLADRFGVDVWEAIEIANLHPRVNILKPGPGVGGHCISVDPWFLVEAAPDISPLIRTARMVNDSQPAFVINLVKRALGCEDLCERRIAALGLAYKADVDDLRESPAIEVAHGLAQAGALVSAYEPYKLDAQVNGLKLAPSLADAIGAADVLLLLVPHTELSNLDPLEVASLTPARIVIDATGFWPRPPGKLPVSRCGRLGLAENKRTETREQLLLPALPRDIMTNIRVLSIFGTRPEAVKMAPVVQRLAAAPEIEARVCVTAQHRQMLDQVLNLFDIHPDVDLDLMRPNQSLAALTAAVFTNLEPVLLDLKPDWILVQGDTTTVMAAAVLGFYHRIKVGHVEAGLRTGDKYQPFPEEINRRIAGVTADLHFAPTETSRQNLLREGVPDNQIVVTGNPAIDALHAIIARTASPEITELLERLNICPGGNRLIAVTAHRRENLGSRWKISARR